MGNFKKVKSGFTLAELLITLAILGVIAVITVPNIIKNNQTRINKTRLKKAMAVYDKAITQMSVENGLKTKDSLKTWGEENNCENSTSYFKRTNHEGCIFKTSDGVWWNLSNTDRPVISFKESNLKEEKARDFDDKEAFILVTSFDDSVGALRIDDLTYETNNPVEFSDVYVAKLYDFISGTDTGISQFNICKAKSADTCTVNGYTYKKMHIEDNTLSSDSRDNKLCLYDRDKTNNSTNCNYTSIAKGGDYYVINLGTISKTDASSEENCISSITTSSSTCTDYYEAARRKCNSLGSRLATVAEIKAMQNSGNNPITSGFVWAVEENRPGYAYYVTKDGYVGGGNGKGAKNGEYLCIGKE